MKRDNEAFGSAGNDSGAGAAYRVNIIALLGALSLFLATLEFLFPKPLPYMRIGLANIPLLIALRVLSVPHFFAVVVLKVSGQAILNGTLGSYVFLFSLGGSFSSALTMLALRPLANRYLSLVGISLLSALVSNIVQLVLSVGIIFGSGALVVAPLFLGIGLFGGIVVGVLAQLCWQHSRWVSLLK